MASVNKNELRSQALSICKPPFEYKRGYIFDANGNTVADNPMEEGALRLRGWGRISHMENPEQLQDEIGEIIADAMSEYWSKHVISE